MGNWKKIIAREWLIFLVVFIVLGFIASVILNSYINYGYKQEYAKRMELYEQSANQWVKDNLSNWKPKRVTLPSKEKAFIDIFSKQYNIIDTFKKVFPKYAYWNSDMLITQLRELNFDNFPEKPRKYYKEITFDDYIFCMLIFGSILYLLTLLIRSIIWSIKKVKQT